MRTHDHSPVVDVVKGAVAGALGTWVMTQTTTWLYAREAAAAREREEAARGGQTAYTAAADSLAGAMHVELSDDQKIRLGTGLHWATGIVAGAKYAVFRRYWPDVSRGFGLLYGTAFFLAVDELMNPLLGLTPGPTAFPWETHGRGLAGHLAYGATTEAVLRAMDALVDTAGVRS
jgi:hypothetical protein